MLMGMSKLMGTTTIASIATSMITATTTTMAIAIIPTTIMTEVTATPTEGSDPPTLRPRPQDEVVLERS